MKTGRFQIYTGNGKGKTTALIGLSVRVACAGMRVYIGQFMKGQKYSELCIPDKFPLIEIEQFGTPDFIEPGKKPSPKDIDNAHRAYLRIKEVLASGRYDLVGADEICVAVHMGLLPEKKAIELVRERPENVELVFTGRYATETMIEKADLVTEMREVKHYYNTEKLPARRGIEN